MAMKVGESEEQRAEKRKRQQDFEKFLFGWDAQRKGKPRVSPQSWTMADRKLFLEGYKAAEREATRSEG